MSLKGWGSIKGSLWKSHLILSKRNTQRESLQKVKGFIGSPLRAHPNRFLPLTTLPQVYPTQYSSCFSNLPGRISTHPAGTHADPWGLGRLDSSFSPSKTFPQVCGFRVKLGSAAIAEVLNDLQSPLLQKIFRWGWSEEFGCSRCSPFQGICQCKLETDFYFYFFSK